MRIMNAADFLLTKGVQAEAAGELVRSALSGDTSVMEAYAKMKAVAETIGTALKDRELTEALISEVDDFGKQRATWHGVEFQRAEMGVKYDYSVCGDSVWNELAEQKRQLEAQMKEREAFLKTITGAIEVADAATGELLAPPARTSSTGVKVTFSKS